MKNARGTSFTKQKTSFLFHSYFLYVPIYIYTSSYAHVAAFFGFLHETEKKNGAHSDRYTQMETYLPTVMRSLFCPRGWLALARTRVRPRVCTYRYRCTCTLIRIHEETAGACVYAFIRYVHYARVLISVLRDPAAHRARRHYRENANSAYLWPTQRDNKQNYHRIEN